MFQIEFHPKVAKDFKSISGVDAKQIQLMLEQKIAQKPEVYGKPLRRTLKNLRSARVGKYRIVYSIQDAKLVVLVLIVSKRETVYEEAKKRL